MYGTKEFSLAKEDNDSLIAKAQFTHAFPLTLLKSLSAFWKLRFA